MAGAVLILLAPVAPIREARKLRARLDALHHEQVLKDVEGIDLQMQRIASHRGTVDDLLERTRAVQLSLQESFRTLRLSEAWVVLRIALATLRALSGLHR